MERFIAAMADWIYHGRAMNTLTEIEAAVESLPLDKKEELLRFIAARLGDEAKAPSHRLDCVRSKRGFPVSKGRAPFTSADVARLENQE